MLRSRLARLLAAALMLAVPLNVAEAIVVAGAEVGFHVSPNGDDAWSGALPAPLMDGSDGPFKTLAKARDAVRERIAGGMDSDIVVMLKGGTHVLNETLVLGLEDSAKDGYKIIYRSFPGDRPVLSSGVPITGWEKLDAKVRGLSKKASANVWVADVPGRLGTFFTLYDGEKRLPRARTKGFSPLPEEEQLDGRAKPFYSNSFDTFKFPKGAPIKNWKNIEDVELIVRPHKPWLMNILPLKSVDLKKRTATTLAATYPMLPVRNLDESIWVENVLEGLDEPGEWVLNTTTKKLYLWPTGDEPGANIVAPALREYIRVEGEGIEAYNEPDKQKDKPASGIHFFGLTFTHGDRGAWNEQDAGIQHDWEMIDKDNAMLRFRGAEDCSVEECEFYNAGGNAIRMDLYAQRIKVSKSHFHDLGQSSVVMIGYGPGTKDVNRDNVVENNRIHHNGQVYWHSQQVIAWQSGHNRIAHNYFHDLPRKAICVSGVREKYFEVALQTKMEERYKNWRECGRSIRWFEVEMKDTSYESRAPYLHARGNVVEFNKAINCSLMLGDGAVINCSGAGDDNVFRCNYVESVNNGSALMRADDNQENMLWEGNILVETNEEASGSVIITKGANTIKNNIIVGRVRLFKGWPWSGANFSNNIYFIPGSEKAVVYGDFFGNLNSPEMKNMKMDNNIYFHAGKSSIKDDKTLTTIRESGHDQNSIYDTDPLFEDWENGDFHLKPSSPALKLGFKQFPYERIGLKPDFPKRFR